MRVLVDAVLEPFGSPRKTRVTEEEVLLGEGVGDVGDVGRDREEEEMKDLAEFLQEETKQRVSSRRRYRRELDR